MKKRRVAPRRVKHRRYASSSKRPVGFGFQRVIVFGTLAVLFFTTVVLFGKNQLTQSVAGLSIARPFFAQATVYLEPVDGAVTYNIYYKKQSEAEFTNAVRSVPTNITFYTISYLRKGESYDYRVSAADTSGREFWWSGTNQISNLEPM